MKESGPTACQECKGALRKVLSAPSFNTANHTSPTAAKYAKMSDAEEIAREIMVAAKAARGLSGSSN